MKSKKMWRMFLALKQRLQQFYVNNILTTKARENFYVETGYSRVLKSIEVSSVAVTNGDFILMGKRKDSGKYTLPGGHLEENEDKHDGAVRELLEEAGVESEARLMEHLKSQSVMCEDGKKREIHAFRLRTDGPPHHTKFDPDEEVAKWEWVPCKDGLPERIKNNLHSPRNIVLEQLGLVKKGGIRKDFSKANIRLPGCYTLKSDKIPGGLADKKKPKDFPKDMLDMGIKVESEHTNDPAIAKEIAMDHLTEDVNYYVKLAKIEKKSEFFINDFIKADRKGPHKYIRKYRRGDEWIYVYHEPGKRGRAISDEELKVLKRLVELKDEGASQLHGSISEHDEEELKFLRRLADLGDHGAIGRLEEYGINRAEEKLEEQLTPAVLQTTDELDLPIDSRKQDRLRELAKARVEGSLAHLNRHVNSPYQANLIEKNITINSVMNNLGSEFGSVRKFLEKLNEVLKPIDEAHRGLGESSNSSATEHDPERGSWGAYGNRIYNETVNSMERADMLPEGYAKAHKRQVKKDGTSPDFLVPNPEDLRRILEERRIRERQEREARERAEQEAREEQMRAIKGTMAYAMASRMSTAMSAEKMLKLDKAIKNIFGSSLTPEQFPYNFENEGVQVKITGLDLRDDNFTLHLTAYDKETGDQLTSDWQRSFNVRGGRPHIHNNYMKVSESKRGRFQLGDLVNSGQRKLMKSVPGGGTVTVHAALSVGAYNWANQGFSFDSGSTLNNYRSIFKNSLANEGIYLTDEQMQLFTKPCHFASFDTGKKYITNVGFDSTLTPKQIKTKSLTGKTGENQLTDEELQSGKTKRMALHFGKKMLLGSSWHGTWDSKKEDVATRYADAYRQFKDQTWAQTLEPEFKELVVKVQSGGASEAPQPRGPPASTPEGDAMPRSYHSTVRRWTNRSGRIVLNARRFGVISGWSEAQIIFFLRENRGKLSQRGASKVNRMLWEIRRSATRSEATGRV